MRTGMFWAVVAAASIAAGCKNCRECQECQNGSRQSAYASATAAMQHGGQTTCPVTGAPLGASAVPVSAGGQTAYVCCANCAAKVQADPAAFIPKVIAERQAAPVPSATTAATLPHGGQKFCPVTGEELDKNAISVNVRGQKVYVCCMGCAAKLKLNPDKYLQALTEDRAKNGVR